MKALSPNFLKLGLVTAVSLLAMIGFDSAAMAADLEIKSDNVRFIGDVEPEEGKRLVQNLEVFRSTILALTGVKGNPDKKPLHVYGQRNVRELNKYLSTRGVGGIYLQSGLEGPTFLTTTKGGFDIEQFEAQVAMHEYSHHVLHGMTIEDFPRWYDEGFANYLSTFKLEGDIITIGTPNAWHGKFLKENKWLDPETVFKSVDNYPRRVNILLFYGQAWLYVHYMQNTPELGKKLPDYLENLSKKMDPIVAFESAYGMTAREFHNAARDYWRENAFPVVQFKADETLLKPPMTIRTLNEDQAALAFATGRRNFMTEKTAKTLQKTYAELSKTMGETKEILVGQTHSALVLEKYEAAENFAKKALSKAPNDASVLSINGSVGYAKLYKAAKKGKRKDEVKLFPNSAETIAVRDAYRKTLDVDPLDFVANNHLIALYGRSSLAIDDTARQAANIFLIQFLRPQLVGQYLDLAYIHAKDNKPTEACTFFRFAEAKTDDYPKKNVNDDWARAQAFKQTYNYCLAAEG